jgi:hypothetical protein
MIDYHTKSKNGIKRLKNPNKYMRIIIYLLIHDF